MRKRPNYGDATSQDLARALMRPELRRVVRYQQRVAAEKAASRSDQGPQFASGRECPTGEIVLPCELADVPLKML